METRSVPLRSVTLGARPWRDVTVRSVRRAQRLVRDTRAGAATALSRPHTCSASVTLPGSAGEESTAPGEESTAPGEESTAPGEESTAPGEESTAPGEESAAPGEESAAPGEESAVAPCWQRSAGGALFPGSAFREACAGASVAAAGGYMRAVREVEGHLRRRAALVAQEAVRLQRERHLLEQTLRGLRANLGLNQRSSAQRTMRPAPNETICDGADELLQSERKELLHLKQELEEALSSALSQIQSLSLCGQRLLSCASERSRVLELLPLSGSRRVKAQSWTQPDPTSAYTPECKAALDSSSCSVKESQRLRAAVRQSLSSALLRQRAAQQTVNDGLLKKVAEIVSLQQTLSSMCGVTRQAMFRKQRELDLIQHNHGRAQGPEYSGDVLSRERLDRPLVQVYHRHPGTQLPEAARLIQGSAVLGRCFSSCQAQLDRLQRSSLLLRGDLQRKSAAAAVDAAVLRMRRERLDKRAVPVLLQQEALRSRS
ncbi:tektin-like protein 1 [Eucyclogobius newberryi]|uniref:tektin-like protein 1 n=1 Tax=Eucyclogobius newberryi TaxID=166745 RepID=UPI003B5C18FB